VSAASPAVSAPRTFDELRAAFAARSHVLGPTVGVRERWHRGRVAYAAWVVRVSGDAVRARVDAVAAALGERIAPVPTADLHVTVQVAGFPTEGPCRFDDDVAEATLHAQAEAVSGVAGGELRVGPANSFASCAIFEVQGAVLHRLQAALGGAHTELRFAPWLPHLTVGTYVADHPVAAVRPALDRPGAPLVVAVDAVELVTFDARVPGAPLITRRVVSLEAAS
jgi:2'-5' RNA ligase